MGSKTSKNALAAQLSPEGFLFALKLMFFLIEIELFHV